MRQRRDDRPHPPQRHQRREHAGGHQHQQLGGERTNEGEARRPQCAAHRQLVRLLGATRQQQQDHVAAGGKEKDPRDQHKEGQEPGGLPVIFGTEPGVVDRPGDEPPVLGPGGGHVGGQASLGKRRQDRGVAA